MLRLGIMTVIAKVIRAMGALAMGRCCEECAKANRMLIKSLGDKTDRILRIAHTVSKYDAGEITAESAMDKVKFDVAG